jgi:putative endopeptidase
VAEDRRDPGRQGELGLVHAKLRENTLPQLRGIIEKAAAGNPAKGTDAQRIGDFYASFMDEARLEQLGAPR